MSSLTDRMPFRLTLILMLALPPGGVAVAEPQDGQSTKDHLLLSRLEACNNLRINIEASISLYNHYMDAARNKLEAGSDESISQLMGAGLEGWFEFSEKLGPSFCRWCKDYNSFRYKTVCPQLPEPGE